MPLVEKTSGGRVYLRSLGRRMTVGDRADVDDETATYLCEVRGDFGRVDDAHDVEFEEVETESDPGEAGPVGDGLIDQDEFDDLADDVLEQRIEDGECPWCDDYEGENVGMHASRSHPEYWAALNED